MYLLRRFGEVGAAAFARKEIHGTFSTAKGQEGISVGVTHAMEERDVFYPGLHGIGDVLARGADPRLVMAELFGKATGLSGGKGGALHIADASHGIMGIFGVLCASVPMAAGHALAARQLNTGAVTVCFVGDRATNEGVFHETLNIISLWRLPVLYVGINNGPEDSDSPVSEHTAAGSMIALARAHGVESADLDGTDALNVYRRAREALDYVRSGRGPYFIEAHCYPLDGLTREEAERLVAEMRATGTYTGFLALRKSMLGQGGRVPPEHWSAGDPLPRLERQMLSERLADRESMAAIRAQVDRLVDEALELSRNSPEPSTESAVDGVYRKTVAAGSIRV